MTSPFRRGTKSQMTKNHGKCTSVGRSDYLFENKRLKDARKDVKERR